MLPAVGRRPGREQSSKHADANAAYLYQQVGSRRDQPRHDQRRRRRFSVISVTYMAIEGASGDQWPGLTRWLTRNNARPDSRRHPAVHRLAALGTGESHGC